MPNISQKRVHIPHFSKITPAEVFITTIITIPSPINARSFSVSLGFTAEGSPEPPNPGFTMGIPKKGVNTPSALFIEKLPTIALIY
jgi:hypothetical protein